MALDVASKNSFYIFLQASHIQVLPLVFIVWILVISILDIPLDLLHFVSISFRILYIELNPVWFELQNTVHLLWILLLLMQPNSTNFSLSSVLSDYVELQPSETMTLSEVCFKSYKFRFGRNLLNTCLLLDVLIKV